MKIKCPFKVGDQVKIIHKPEWGIGRVVQIGETTVSINGATLLEDGDNIPLVRVSWSGLVSSKRGWWAHPLDLEFAETPIERMKRRYNE